MKKIWSNHNSLVTPRTMWRLHLKFPLSLKTNFDSNFFFSFQKLILARNGCQNSKQFFCSSSKKKKKTVFLHFRESAVPIFWQAPIRETYLPSLGCLRTRQLSHFHVASFNRLGYLETSGAWGDTREWFWHGSKGRTIEPCAQKVQEWILWRILS